MTLDEFNTLCAGLPQTTKVIQWMGCHVWKVGDKVFAIGAPGVDVQGKQPGETPCPFTIKTDEMAFGFLREEPNVDIAPHLKRGNWLRFEADCAIDFKDLSAYIERSHALIVNTLTKKKREELGLAQH